MKMVKKNFNAPLGVNKQRAPSGDTSTSNRVSVSTFLRGSTESMNFLAIRLGILAL